MIQILCLASMPSSDSSVFFLLSTLNKTNNSFDLTVFTEVCDTCHTEYIRNYEIQSIGLNYTGRNCTLGRGDNGEESSSPCPGKLKDTLLDWEDDLPELDWNRAKSECQRADLILCLGTSLRIEPAASLCTFPNSNYQQPRRRRKKEKNTTTKSKNDDQDNDDDENQQQQLQLQQQPPLGYVIVNLQPTPYDDGAALVIRAKVDDVMREVMDKLGYGDENGWKSRKSF
jgi:mono-ADP-ribosyltransferase sirtuin 6